MSRRIARIVAGSFVVVLCTRASATLELHEAYYRPDAVEYAWEPGNVRSAGSIHVYLKNVSEKPVHVRDVRLLGSTVKRLVAAPLPMSQRQVYWFRIVPNPLKPGEVGNVLIRLAREPEQRTIDLVIETDAGQTLSVPVPLVRPSISLSYVSFSEDFRTLYAYVRKDLPEPPPVGALSGPLEGRPKGLAISKVWLDGTDVTPNSFIPDPGFFLGIALVQVQLQEPVPEGSVHTLRIEAGPRASTAYQVRATKPLFAIGSYWVPPPEEGYNVGLSFGQAPKAFLDILHEKHLVGGGDYFPSHGQTEWDRESLGQYLRTIRDHPALQFVYLDDEPDCRDFEYGGEGRVELGYTAMSMVRKMEFLREACPRQPTFIAINNTWRPACYFVYGELADAMAPHSYGNEIVHSAEQSAQVKRAVEPRASYYTPWLDLGKRPQTAEDMRLRVYYPLSEGMKGIIYYAWKFAATVTPDKGQALRDAMAEMHKEFQAVAPLLIKGELVPMADSSHPALRLRAFLCADEAVVLFVINENRNDFMASDTYRDEAGAPKGKLREVLPTKDVRIDLALPDWFSPGSVVSLSGATATPIPSTVTSPGISLLLPEVGLTKLIVVRRDADKGPRTIALADRRPEDVDYLSDLQPIRVNGIAFSRDRNLQRQPIILGGKTWPKGIGLAAPGEIVYRLDGKYSAFEALIGMDVADLEKNEDLKKALLRLPPSDTHRRAIFLIFVDGVKAFDSGLMRLQDPPRPVRVALSHARELKLVMNEEIVPGGDNGLWAGACLVKP